MTKSFGSHIGRMRNEARASVRDLSLNTGITQQDIEKLEAGVICASKDQVFRLANYFAFDEKEFLQISQASRIIQETSKFQKQCLNRSRSAYFNNSPLATKRIDNMKRDLDLLETRTINVKMHIPRPELRSFIDSIVYCKGHNLGHAFESTLPDGTAQLQIVIGEGGRELISNSTDQVQQLSKAWLMGINDIPVTYRLTEVEGTIYVRFKPAGLYAFTRIHQVELNNAVIDAKLIFGASIEILWEDIASFNEPMEMILRVEDFFLKKLDATASKPDLLTYMLDHIHLSRTQLAKKTGYSAKYLTETFQKYIGVGPKNLQRIQRFNSAISYLNQLS